MKQALRFLFALLFFAQCAVYQAAATHIMGGYVSWERITSGAHTGKYYFRLHFVRDCNTFVSPIPGNAQIQLTQGIEHVSTALELEDDSDVTAQGCGFSCEVPGDFGRAGYVLRSQPTSLSQFSTAASISVVMSACCRSTSQNVLEPTSQNLYFRAVMHPIAGPDGQMFFDDSPVLQLPYTFAACAGSTFDWALGVVDPNGDSLVYEPDFMAIETGAPIQMVNATFDQPFPGPSSSPSFPLSTFDPTIGRWRYDVPPSVQGRFALATKMSAYRCGQLVSENTVENIVVFTPCATSDPRPAVSLSAEAVPIGDDLWLVSAAAGDTVRFTLNATDNGTIAFDAAGEALSADFSTSNGDCDNGPCATLAGLLPGAQATIIGTTQFEWAIDCGHMKCEDDTSYYQFTFRYRDDHCPANVRNVGVRVQLTDQLTVPSPWPTCTRYQSADSIRIRWDASQINGAFVGLVIQHSAQPQGPFVAIDTVFNPNASGYWHVLGLTPSDPIAIGANHYRVRSISPCQELGALEANASISSIFLNIENSLGQVHLIWNALSYPALSTSVGISGAIYKVMREYPAGTWTQVAQLSGLSYSEAVVSETEMVSYRIEVDDQMPCTSVSNTVGGVFSTMDEVSMVSGAMTVVPNPSNGTFTITVPVNGLLGRLSLSDLSGRVLWTCAMNSSSIQVEATDLRRGIYLAEVLSQQGRFRAKVVID